MDRKRKIIENKFLAMAEGRDKRDDEVSLGAKLKNFLKENFIIGLIFSGPVFGTIYILFLFLSFLDGIFGGLYDRLIGFHVPGAGLITLFIFVILVGVFARTYLASFFLQMFERYISKIPLASTIYSAFKTIADLFQQNKSGFGRPVLIVLDYIYFVGFELSSDGKTSTVLLPSAPTPTTGFTFVVPTSRVFYLKTSSDDAMKFILSLGAYSKPISDEIATLISSGVISKADVSYEEKREVGREEGGEK